MNILRWRRKSKKKIKLKTIILVIFSLIMTTFAWFAYSKILNTSLNIHMISWDMEYYIGSVKQTNPIGINVDTLYPTMNEFVQTIDIKNNGESLVDIEYFVESVTVAGISFELVQEGETNTEENYIILTPSVLETDETTGVKKSTGAITNDVTNLPFTVEVEYSPQVQPFGQGYLKVMVNWIGDNDLLDSKWGYIVGEYLNNNPSESAMSIELSINSYQADPSGSATTETLPSTSETTPYLPTGFTRLAGTNLNTGLVIKDNVGNEYVWVEVPRNTTVYPNAQLGITEFTSDEYTTIENDLKAYVSTYRNGTSYVDLYPSGTVYRAVGIAYDDYIELKQKMLKSIYQNGGFYIGRYEAGIEERARNSSTTSTPAETPVVKADVYPFNFITCAQAQTKASGMTSGDNTSSLLFGIQWDLVMKYLETKGVDSSELTSNSVSWGNYNDNLYYITRPFAKYYLSEWTTGAYEKAEKADVLLSTGASSIFQKQNISDLAGNMSEWTLEYSAVTGSPSAYRGGSYTHKGEKTVNDRFSSSIDGSAMNIGFRITIF